jgi:hypothetical protein
MQPVGTAIRASQQCGQVVTPRELAARSSTAASAPIHAASGVRTGELYGGWGVGGWEGDSDSAEARGPGDEGKKKNPGVRCVGRVRHKRGEPEGVGQETRRGRRGQGRIEKKKKIRTRGGLHVWFGWAAPLSQQDTLVQDERTRRSGSPRPAMEGSR